MKVRYPLRRSVIPGFGLSLGITLVYLGVIVLLPLCALILKASDVGLTQLMTILSSPRTLSAIRVTVTMALAATAFNAVYGLMLAWVLARYEFPASVFWTPSSMCRSRCRPPLPALH